MKIYDTNYLVNHFQRKTNFQFEGNFFFTDVNLYEWLKGKNKETRIEKFDEIEKFIKETNSTYCFREEFKKYEHKLDYIKNQCIRFKIAEKVSLLVLKDIIDTHIVILFFILLLLLIKQNDVLINDNGEFEVISFNDKYVSDLNHLFVRLVTDFRKNRLHKLSKIMFLCSKETVEKAFVDWFNVMIESINNFALSNKLSSISNEHLNYDNIIKNNNIVCDEKEIDCLINQFIKANKNEELTHSFFSFIIKPMLLTKNTKYEFNDIADMYLKFSADRLNVEYKTYDKKFKGKVSCLNRIRRFI